MSDDLEALDKRKRELEIQFLEKGLANPLPPWWKPELAKIVTILLGVTVTGWFGWCFEGQRQQLQKLSNQMGSLTTELNNRKLAVEVRKLESESLSFECNIYNPDISVGDSTGVISLRPLVCTITNEGETPIHLKSLEYRIYTASLEQIVTTEPVDFQGASR